MINGEDRETSITNDKDIFMIVRIHQSYYFFNDDGSYINIELNNCFEVINLKQGKCCYSNSYRDFR